MSDAYEKIKKLLELGYTPEIRLTGAGTDLEARVSRNNRGMPEDAVLINFGPPGAVAETIVDLTRFEVELLNGQVLQGEASRLPVGSVVARVGENTSWVTFLKVTDDKWVSQNCFFFGDDGNLALTSSFILSNDRVENQLSSGNWEVIHSGGGGGLSSYGK